MREEVLEMPGFDGTGPRGMGPMTGGGRGFCASPAYGARPGYAASFGWPAWGGRGGGFGRGMGRGMGRGRGRGFAYPYANRPGWNAPAPVGRLPYAPYPYNAGPYVPYYNPSPYGW
jgi:hypothetical protein